MYLNTHTLHEVYASISGILNYLFQGNIRVFCRVRPLLGDELLGNDGHIQHMAFPDEDKHTTLELEKLADSLPNEVRKKLYFFTNLSIWC